MGYLVRLLPRFFLITMLHFFSACGPGIPLTPSTSSVTILTSGDDINQTVSLTDPSKLFVNNQTESVTFTLTLSRKLTIPLSTDQVTVIKTGTANTELTISGSETEYTITLTSFSGNGTIGLSFTIGATTFTFPTKLITIDNLSPQKTSAITVPTTPVTAVQAQIGWTAVDDSSDISYQIKLCNDNICSIDCSEEVTTDENEITLGDLVEGSYYACVQTVDLAENQSGFKSSDNPFIVDQTPLSLIHAMILLSSPNHGTTSSDTTPTLTGSGIESETTLTIYSNNSCSNQLSTGTVSSNGTITLSNITLAVDGTTHFYGKLIHENDETLCIDLQKEYLLDTTAPDLQNLTNLTLTSPNNGTTSNDKTPIIGGNGENGVIISLYDENSCTTPLESITISSGSFLFNNITYNDLTDDGNKHYYAILTDTVGNATSCSDLNLSYLLDTTPPADPSGWSFVTPTNSSTSNETTPSITKSGLASENGSSISIFDESSCTTPTGSATISGGSFTVSDISYASNGTDDGTKLFYGLITDIGGNSSNCVNLNLSYLLDTVSPANPTGWSIDSPANGVTSSDITPTFEGIGLSSENGGSVSIYDSVGCSDSSIGSATIAGGTFTVINVSYPSDGTNDGTLSFYGKITDVGGNESDCVDLSLGYQLDTTAPSNPTGWTLSSPNSGTTSSDMTPQIAGSGLALENGGTATIYDSAGCGSSIGSSSIAGGSFTVSNITYLNDGSQDGTKTFYGKITDNSGNSSSCISLSLAYKLDTTNPTNPSGWTMSSPNSGTTSNDSSPQIDGAGLAVENGGSVAIYDDVSCIDVIGTATISGGSFSVTNISYAVDGSDDGSKTFYGKIVDISNNSSACVSLGLSYRYDHTNPSDPTGWTIATPSNGVTSNDVTPQISGSGLADENGGTVTIYGAGACSIALGSATISGGSFTVSNITYLSDGSQDDTKTLYGKMTDVAGNESGCVDLSLGYLLDTTSPSDPSGWTMASPNSGTTSNDITPQISKAGLAAENGGTVYIYDNIACASSIGTAVIAGGTFTVSNITYLNNGTQDGTKTFYGKITDAGGNSSTCVNLSLGYLLDTTNPSNPSGWTMSSPNTGTTSNDITPQIAGAGLTAENGASLSIYDSSGCAIPIGSSTIAGGSFTVSNITYLNDGSDDGTMAFYGKITDVGGNSSSCVNLTLGYKLDTILPADPIGWSFTNVTDGETSGNFTPQITGAGLASENKSTVNIYLTGACGASVGSAVINAGTFTVTNISFADDGSADGIKTFYGAITDAGGNVSNCTDLSLTYELNTSIPSVSISVPTASDFINNANKGSFTVSGECSEDGRTVTVNATGGLSATPSCTGTTWTTNLDFTAVANGAVTITADHDNAGATPAPQASVTLTKDAAIPSDPAGWTLSSPNDGTTSSDYTPQIGGAGLVAENGASIDIYTAVGCVTSVGTAEVAGGTFTVSNITFASNGTADGDKSFYGKITDVAGNSSDCVDLTLTYHLDTTLPSNPSGWTMSSPNSATTSNDVTPEMSGAGLAAENESAVTIYDAIACSAGIGSATIAGGTFTVSNITYLNDGSQDGAKAFYGKIVDPAGNSSSCVSLNLNYKLDTIVPSDPTGWTMATPSTGSTTNDNTPQISGSSLSSENGGGITIYDAVGCVASVGTATISSGSFTVSNISYLNNGTQDGTKTFYGKITDVGGNESNCVALSLSYLLDSTVPSNPSGWTMSSPNTGTTSNDNTPQISGSGLAAENGSAVTIHATGTCSSSIGSATIAGGTFTVSNITYLNNGTQDGTKAFYGLITDTAGNSSACTSLSLGYLLDTTAPSNPSGWTMSSPNTGTTSNDHTPQMSGSGLAAENGGIVSISNAVDCSSPVGSATIAGGTFTVSNISYANDGSADGTKTFYGKITDVGGNSSSCISLSLTYLLDTTVPSNPSGWTMSSPNSGTTSSDYTPQIAGTGLSAENGSSISISNAVDCSGPVGSATIAGGAFTVSNVSYASDGSADGTKTFYGKITDIAGNSSACTSLSLAYLLDATIPSDPSGWTMSSPNTGTTSNDYTPQISKSGLASENSSTVTIYDTGACSVSIGSATIAGGSFTVSNITYASNGSQDGSKSFYGKIVDVAGNSSNCVSLSLEYLLDTTAPSNPSAWSMGSPSTGTSSNDYTPQISKASGLDSENGSTVSIYDAGGCAASIGSATIASGSFTVSNISYASNGSQDGTKTFYGKITDIAGNSSACSALSLGYLLDTTVPTLSITAPLSTDIIGRTNQGIITVSGSCSENGRTVTIGATGSLTATPTCSSGSYTSTLNFDTVTDGTITITADISDAVGNTATQASVALTKLTAWSAVRSFAMKGYHTCAQLSDSSVKCWGPNSEGALGQGHANHLGDGANEMGNNLSSINLGTSRSAAILTTGTSHSCAILDNSSVKCWGKGTIGQLGQGNANHLGDSANEMGTNLSTIKLGSNRTALKIVAGQDYTCVLLDNSTIKCWGDNAYGNLGLGHANAIASVANQMGDNLVTVNLGTGKSAINLFSGHYNVCAILDDGTLKCWGHNGYGQLGQGQISTLGDEPNEMGDNLSTIDLGTGRSILRGYMGGAHACVLLDNSTVKCWGVDEQGQLGLGITTYKGDEADEMGDNLSTIKLGTSRFALDIGGGTWHSCVVLDNGTAKCWGYNEFGQLGQGHTSNLGDSANEMGNNLSSIKLGSSRTAISIQGSLFSTCILLDNYTVKCWGYNTEGQLGQGNTTQLGDGANEMGDNLSAITLSSPTRIVTKIYNQGWSTCAQFDGGGLKCWGYNGEGYSGEGGNLGQGSVLNAGNGPGEMGYNLSEINLGTGRSVFRVGTGMEHSCVILDNLTLKCFGYNVVGALGQGHAQNLGDNANEMGGNLSTVKLGTNRYPLAVDAGYYHTCALLDNASVKCWGIGTYGITGQGHTADLGNNPNEMGDNLSTVALSSTQFPISISSGWSHACALLNDSTVKCWGYSGTGEAGQGITSNIGDEVDEMGDNLATVNIGTGLKAINLLSGGGHNCVTLTDSSLKCWGQNAYGQLGQGNANQTGDAPDEMGDNLSTINLGNNKRAFSITAGTFFTCALLDDRSIKCWGDNTYGQLGRGNTTNYGDSANEMGTNLSTIKLGTSRTAVALTGHNGSFICALLDNSTVKCWGDNAYGQLGQGHTNNIGDNTNEMGDNLSIINLW